ncbi:hypothetical protein [Infirmifilum sp. SLHALR2]|nr:MAG: hypothetical protein B7L53_08265 [Thermofilum sp. NZ13]
MDEKLLRYFREVLGAVTLAVLIASAYYSYKVLAYVLNWEPGTQQMYTSYMTTLIYLLFTLTSLFLFYETLKRAAEQRA